MDRFGEGVHDAHGFQSLARLADCGKIRHMVELLTIREVCTVLRLGERTVYQLCRDGRLAGAVKVGGKWRVDRDALMEWVKKEGQLAEADGQSGGELNP